MSGSKKNGIVYLEDDDINAFNEAISREEDLIDNYVYFLKKKKKVHFSEMDVSKVTDMQSMFRTAESFNGPIGHWNVSKVTDMSNMFHSAKSFNQPIGNWNVSNVTTMAEMFCEAHLFNQDIRKWDVSKVTNMEAMFESAESFNQPIGDWNVSKVTDMQGMFRFAESFNQPIGDWNVSKVTNMWGMFDEADSFNQDISQWNVSKVKDIHEIGFDKPLKPKVAYSVYQWFLKNRISDIEAERIFGGAAKLEKYKQEWLLRTARMFKGNVELSNRVKRNLMKEFKKKGSKMTDTKFKRLTKSTFSKNPNHEGDLDATLKVLNHEPMFNKIMGYVDPNGTKKRKSASKSKSATKSPKNKRQTRSASKSKSANQTRSAKSAKSI
jgi:surface protein